MKQEKIKQNTALPHSEEQCIAEKKDAPPPAGKKRKKFLSYMREQGGNYLMLLPAAIVLIMFSYVPMYGLYTAFVNYNLDKGLFGSEFMGFYYFELMFSEPDLWMMVRNTLVLNLWKLLITFPAPIVLALLINELNNKVFKKTFQTVSYLPNFISWVIVSGMLTIFLNTDDGILNRIIEVFGGQPVSWYSDASKWRGILVITALWKNMGWGSIMYLAALTAVDKELYEAAEIDGAGRFRQIISITLPAIAPTISITLILTIGKLFSDDFDQIYSLAGGRDALRDTTEVIGTKVFAIAKGGTYRDFPLSTAYGLMQGVISLFLILSSNFIAKKLGQEGMF